MQMVMTLDTQIQTALLEICNGLAGENLSQLVLGLDSPPKLNSKAQYHHPHGILVLSFMGKSIMTGLLIVLQMSGVMLLLRVQQLVVIETTFFKFLTQWDQNR